LLNEIVSITGIDDKVLGFETTLKIEFLRRTMVTQRMSWAASRSTTRLEDKAYCLLGLFDVNMPLLYGEGATAFIRLQEEIIKLSTDHSIFAWDSTPNIDSERLLLAPSVSCFRNCGTVCRLREQTKPEPYSMTNVGLSIRLPVINTWIDDTIAILSCRYADDLLGPIGLSLQSTGGDKAYFVSSSTRHRCGKSRHGGHTYEGRTFAVDVKDIPQSTMMSTLLLLRQPPTDFSLPLAHETLDTFTNETATAVLIHEDFGSPGMSPPWMCLGFSIKALYPSMYWSKTLSNLPGRGKRDILLLPPKVHVGAIRIWYRATSFFITFGLEQRNWHQEALDCWINIRDSENDITIREMARREEKPHRVDGFAVSKYGKNKATLIPWRFPDDCLEVSISRKYVMGEEMFEVSGKVKKLTVSPSAITSILPPQTNADTTHHSRPAMIEWRDSTTTVIQSRFPVNLCG
jgi:hypothetical protein